MKLVVGSTAALKHEALQLALRRLGLPIPVIHLACPSGVNAQPFELKETQHGAYNRALGALLSCPDADIGVGIENGLFKNPEGLTDRAVCLMLVRSPDDIRNWRYVGILSAPVVMPEHAIAIARQRGFATTTVGAVLHELNPACAAQDPHLFLSGCSRLNYLADALQQLVVTLQIGGIMPPSPPARASAYSLG